MGRRSSIDRLPAAVRDKIGALRQEGRTIDEIMAKLDELNVDVSRSAVGRHCKRLESIQASIRQSRTIAEAIVKDYGDEDKENKVARANIEVLHSILFRMMGSEDGEPVTLGLYCQYGKPSGRCGSGKAELERPAGGLLPGF